MVRIRGHGDEGGVGKDPPEPPPRVPPPASQGCEQIPPHRPEGRGTGTAAASFSSSSHSSSSLSLPRWKGEREAGRSEPDRPPANVGCHHLLHGPLRARRGEDALDARSAAQVEQAARSPPPEAAPPPPSPFPPRRGGAGGQGEQLEGVVPHGHDGVPGGPEALHGPVRGEQAGPVVAVSISVAEQIGPVQGIDLHLPHQQGIALPPGRTQQASPHQGIQINASQHGIALVPPHRETE